MLSDFNFGFEMAEVVKRPGKCGTYLVYVRMRHLASHVKGGCLFLNAI